MQENPGPGGGEGLWPLPTSFSKCSLVWPFLRWSSRKTRIWNTKAGNLWGRSIRPCPLLPQPARVPRAAEQDRRPRMRPGRGLPSCTSGGSRSPGSPAHRRHRRPGRGASGHAPSRAERDRAEPSVSEHGRAEPSGRQSVSAAASPPLSSLRLRRRRRLSRACAGRPAARREARSAVRAARPRAPPPPPLPGERLPRPAGPPARVSPRLSVLVSVCLSACQPPVSARAPSRHV